MEDFPVAARLKALISSLGLTDSQFADKCSISRSTLSLLLSGKNKKISDVMLSQIHEAFPDVSIMWLLFGEGNQFISEEKDEIKENILIESQEFSDNGTSSNKFLNLVDINQLENIVKEVVNKSVNGSFQTLEKLVLKNADTNSQRKVSKITVYYGDSTFETFIPE